MTALRKVTPHYRYTPEEYLAMEESAGERLEYVEGEIVAMAGTSIEHNDIVGNIVVGLKGQFRGSPRKVNAISIRVRVSETHYRYLDVVAFCGEAQTIPTNPPVLINPIVIFEVLSPTTKTTDEGEKFYEYAQNETLTDYVLVAQRVMRVLHYHRLTEKDWNVSIYTQAQDSVRLESVDASLTLADIYDGIVFPPPLTLARARTKRKAAADTP